MGGAAGARRLLLTVLLALALVGTMSTEAGDSALKVDGFVGLAHRLNVTERRQLNAIKKDKCDHTQTERMKYVSHVELNQSR